jgi:hypothetical protein
VVWSSSGAAFWDPENRTRCPGAVPPPPLKADIRFSGDIGQAWPDLIYWADGLAYNMQNDEWREIASPPSHPDRARAAFDGYELVVAG